MTDTTPQGDAVPTEQDALAAATADGSDGRATTEEVAAAWEGEDTTAPGSAGTTGDGHADDLAAWDGEA